MPPRDNGAKALATYERVSRTAAAVAALRTAAAELRAGATESCVVCCRDVADWLDHRAGLLGHALIVWDEPALLDAPADALAEPDPQPASTVHGDTAGPLAHGRPALAQVEPGTTAEALAPSEGQSHPGSVTGGRP